MRPLYLHCPCMMAWCEWWFCWVVFLFHFRGRFNALISGFRSAKELRDDWACSRLEGPMVYSSESQLARYEKIRQWGQGGADLPKPEWKSYGPGRRLGENRERVRIKIPAPKTVDTSCATSSQGMGPPPRKASSESHFNPFLF